ncbi:MAG: hypothetical protein GY953_03665 [bacterium]|nr:hypothetical protein [bacterium]
METAAAAPAESPAPGKTERRKSFEEFQAATRDQIEAAWQIHVNRVEDELAKGWRMQIENVLRERFAELAGAMESELERTAGSATRDLTEQLNQAARRLRGATDSREWVSALLDAAALFCECAALFRVTGGRMTLEGGVGLVNRESEDAFELRLAAAPAFDNAVQSLEPVAAMASAGELSEPVLQLIPESPDGKVSLLPVVSQGQAVAVLFASGGEEPLDWNALELLANLAASVLDAQAAAQKPASAGLVSIGEAEPDRVRTVTSWAELSREDQDRHLRAQRFARVQVAELRLYQSQPVKEGRAERNLYGKLRGKIDAGREAFSKEYMSDCESMVDYYHLELVRTLANDEEALLGPEYPGPIK